MRRKVLSVTGAMLMSSLLPATPILAADYALSGASDTILRVGRTADDKTNVPLYEYLRLSVASTQKDRGTISLNVGGWGRVDLADRSSFRKGADGDLQYGYLGFQCAKNNTVLNIGRQFVNEGVAAQRLDGIYLRSDLVAGFGAAAYVGQAVVTEPSLRGDDLVFGGRISQSNYKYYSLGVSALKSYASGSSYREEEGVDLWLHPVKQVDVTGRSSYNSLTNGWMEHAYTVSLSPIDNLRFFGDLSRINYRDYFFRVTTNALVFNPLVNGIDPNEKMLALGGGGSYTFKNLTLAADYKHYDYDVARAADYYGAKLSYYLPASYSAGASVHRMSGTENRLKFTEYRLFASKKWGPANLTLDVIDLNYDNPATMNDVKNAVTVVAAGSYQLLKDLQLGGSVDYSHNPFFDNDVRGLVKLTYLFEVNRSGEGGTKGEK